MFNSKMNGYDNNQDIGRGNFNIDDMRSDRIVPEEYKLNSQMINKLIKQNKEMNNKLNSKQDEINRLNSLIGSLRGKLIKYTELNRKLTSDFQNFRHNDLSNNNINNTSGSITEDANDYIQVPKRRSSTLETPPDSLSTPTILKNSNSYDEKITSLTEKLDQLTSLVLEKKTLCNTKPVTKILGNSPQQSIFMQEPSEEDIMIKESVELKNLENQIDSMKRKLLIKRENELRKISLNQELLELMDKLSLQEPSVSRVNNPNIHNNIDLSPPLSRSDNTSPDYCLECHTSSHHSHNHSHNHNHNNSRNPNYQRSSYLKKPDIPSTNPLETPTPLAKRSDSQL